MRDDLKIFNPILVGLILTIVLSICLLSAGNALKEKRFEKKLDVLVERIEEELPGKILERDENISSVTVSAKRNELIINKSSSAKFHNDIHITVNVKEQPEKIKTEQYCEEALKLYYDAGAEVEEIKKQVLFEYASEIKQKRSLHVSNKLYGKFDDAYSVQLILSDGTQYIKKTGDSYIYEVRNGKSVAYDKHYKYGIIRKDKLDKIEYDKYMAEIRKKNQKKREKELEQEKRRQQYKGKITNPYAVYDKGYEDVWLDGDYDHERYQRDSEYARGVDDALEYEDWDW